MECSVALVSSKYLPWRATVYAATCQCYYDCRYYDDGEVFFEFFKITIQLYQLY